MIWRPFFRFFIMADTKFPFLLTLVKAKTQLWQVSVIVKNIFVFLLTLGKAETQTLGVGSWKVSVQQVFTNWQSFLHNG